MYRGLASFVEALRAGGEVEFKLYTPYLYRLDELLSLANEDIDLLRKWKEANGAR